MAPGIVMESNSADLPTLYDTKETKARFSKILHGNDAQTKTGIMAVLSKDHDAQRVQTDTYFQFFDNKTGSEEDTKNRTDNYSMLTNAYYDLATDFYEYGWSPSFHFCRYYPGESFHQGIIRHEHYLAMKMGIQNNDRILDVGCGVGGPAREIARFTGADITGITINQYQVDRANTKFKRMGLDKSCRAIQGNFMEIPFEENTFDKVYAIEATVHAPRLEGVYGEIFRVLKPGGIFGVYEWVMTDKYDKNNPEHRAIALGIEVGDGISQMVKVSDARNALLSVGFDILHEEDLAARKDAVPWYYPIAGDLKYVRSLWDMVTVFRMTKPGRWFCHNALWVLEKMRIAPPGMNRIGDALATAADYLVEGGRQELFTPMMLFIVKKPE